MSGVTFLETVRRGWRTMLAWGIGLGLMGYFQAVIVPDADALQEYAELYQTMPELMEGFGLTDAAFGATPEGYLATQWFSFILVIFAVYAVFAGLAVTANDEDQGILNAALALPIRRWRFMAERAAAYALLIIGAIVISGLGVWFGVESTPALTMDTSILIPATVNIIPGALAILAATVFFGGVIRRKGLMTALITALVVGSYFLDFIGRAASESLASDLRGLSLFRYYDGVEVVRLNALQWGNVAVLLAVAAILLVAGLVSFQRRDLA
jgi:putative exporter of polyketide antibiotics